MPQLHETGMGHKFFGQFGVLVGALTNIATELKRANDLKEAESEEVILPTPSFEKARDLKRLRHPTVEAPTRAEIQRVAGGMDEVLTSSEIDRVMGGCVSEVEKSGESLRTVLDGMVFNIVEERRG